MLLRPVPWSIGTLILRGSRARIDKGDLHPYLDRADPYDLMLRSLKAYYAQHQHYPARVVILKTSRFEHQEAGGFREALKEAQVAYADLIWISESSPLTMFREGYARLVRSAVSANTPGRVPPFSRFHVPASAANPDRAVGRAAGFLFDEFHRWPRRSQVRGQLRQEAIATARAWGGLSLKSAIKRRFFQAQRSVSQAPLTESNLPALERMVSDHGNSSQIASHRHTAFSQQIICRIASLAPG